MNSRHDKGMTLIEVTIALTIMLIGIGFIVKSDSVSSYYRSQHELRQQMFFYAAGLIEASVEGQDINATQDYKDFTVSVDKDTDARINGNPVIQPQPLVSLKQVKVTITSGSQTVILSTYRVIKTDEYEP